MNRYLYLAAALMVACGLQSQAARAQDNRPPWAFLFIHQDPRLTGTGVALGIGSDVASYALVHKHGVPATRIASPAFAYGITAFGCAVVYPILGTLVLHRALTPREAYVGIAGCVVPIVGSWIVDAMLPHTRWYDGVPARPHHRYYRRHHYRR
jgi:hypothetical protein